MDQFQQEKDAVVNRQQTELLTLRVWIMHADLLTCNSTFYSIVTAEEDPRIEMSCIVGFICYVQSAQLTFPAKLYNIAMSLYSINFYRFNS